jgi:hypothetical protein
MAKIILSYRRDMDEKGELPTYNLSTYTALLDMGHEVTRIGEGQETYETIDQVPDKELRSHDLFIDLDCGRNKNGNLHFQLNDKRLSIPSAIRFIDTHGYPSLHRRLAKNYEYVFFAVWRRRDLFANHSSAHWCPNASDDLWFDFTKYTRQWSNPIHSFGFFGSKGGLNRADDLVALCDANDAFTCDVREIGRNNKRRWPRTAQVMAKCKVFYNRGQKHDGPNQRVIESMLMNRPLITDRDAEDGMNKLFKEGEHLVMYSSRAELDIQMKWVMSEYDVAKNMAQRAYNLVKEEHLVKHRVKQILEVCLT